MRPELRPVAETFGSPSAQDWTRFQTWARYEGWRVPARELSLYRCELASSAVVLRDAHGETVGFVTVCRHQHHAWIGNLIVDPSQRGKGHGRRLFRHALGTLSARGATTLWLTASAAGLPLYADLGFVDVGRIERWTWRGQELAAANTLPDGNGELHELARADAAAWGYSRAGLLTLLARGSRIFKCGGTVAMLQPENGLNVLGPWLSADHCPRANRAVLAMILEACGGRGEVAVDVSGGSPARILLYAAGFRQAGETVLMVRGKTERMKFGEIVALASLGSMG